MNHQIEQLVKRAGGLVTTRNLASNPVQYKQTVELWDDRIEAFANLLINDVVDYLMDEAENLHELAGEEQSWQRSEKLEFAADHCIDLIAGIEKRFGVGR